MNILKIDTVRHWTLYPRCNHVKQGIYTGNVFGTIPPYQTSVLFWQAKSAQWLDNHSGSSEKGGSTGLMCVLETCWWHRTACEAHWWECARDMCMVAILGFWWACCDCVSLHEWPNIVIYGKSYIDLFLTCLLLGYALRALNTSSILWFCHVTICILPNNLWFINHTASEDGVSYTVCKWCV